MKRWSAARSAPATQSPVSDTNGPRDSDDEVALGASPERFECAIELLPAPRQRTNPLLRDRHVRLERAWRDAGVVVVIDADAVLLLGFAIRLQGNLAGTLARRCE